MFTFAKACPKCGKRFGVKIAGRKLVNQEKDTEDETVDLPVGPGRQGGGLPIMTSTEVLVTYTRDTYETNFHCSKCNHDWTETRVKLTKTR